MPEQGSRRGVEVTSAPFTAPFDTPLLRMGQHGLNLVDAPDAIREGQFLRLTNIQHEGQTGQMGVRPGLTALAAAGTTVHSCRRMNAPRTSSFTRVWGIDTGLYAGASGALTNIDAGYSGDPLALVPYRPPQSADTWIYVGDRLRARKVRSSDNLDLPISPVPPSLALASSLETEQRTNICLFDSTDGTQAAGWVATPGFGFGDTSTKAAGPIVINDFGGAPSGGDGVAFEGSPGSAGNPFAPNGYWFMVGRPKTLNLSQVGIYTATDDDLIHLYLNLSHVEFITEVRIYLVCSSTFSASVVPGTKAGTNADFYMKAFSAHDFSRAVVLQQTMLEASETARIHDIRDERLRQRKIDDDRDSWRERRAERDPARSIAPQGPGGNDAWTEYGVVGVPLRRGEFQRFGSTAGRDWATITGIIIYVAAGPKALNVAVRFDDLYLHGGSGPDTSEPGALQYDYRYTHYDPRTGDETNGSPEQVEANKLDSLRRAVSLTPAAYGDSAIRQRFYRRGGSLTADWFFLGENESDGEVFQDRTTDLAIVSAGTLELDNDEFVTTVDEAGETVHAQPLPIVFGPCEDLLFALGDPYRPGHTYWCKPGRPGSWPPQNTVEVCAPGEVLQNGGVWGTQPFVFSQEALYWLYPNLTSTGNVTATPSGCRRGLLARWALAITPIGIAFLNEDGIYVTTGGPPDLLTRDIDPLFHGQSSHGYRPINLAILSALRLEYFDHELWFLYQDDQGSRRCLVYSLLGQYWRSHQYAPALTLLYADEGGTDNQLIAGGQTSGKAYTIGGTTDDGTPIAWNFRTGWNPFGRPREDKLFGDLIADLDAQGRTVSVRPLLNEETVINPFTELTGTGRRRYVWDPFGLSPQKARNLALDVTGDQSGPIFYQFGVSLIPQPDLTVNRVTQWDDLGHPDEVYLTGLTIDVDTGNVARQFMVEYDIEGAKHELGPFTVQSNNRHKFKFSWAAVKANLVRIRPIGDCLAWILYRADWIFDPEPPRIAGWDINFENGWDQYVTGVDLDCNTFGQGKTIEVSVDGTIVLTKTINTTARRVVHLTVQPPVRGHLLQFRATDANPGLLYAHRWHTEAEPSEQTNWNQNFTVAGALPAKYLKGVVLECDTFGQTKAVTIEVDGLVVETLSVNTPDRRVVERSFPQQLGRVFRLLPTDANPGRLYSLQWIFDQEPLQLTRWETQETDHDQPNFSAFLSAQITLKSTAPVFFDVTIHTTQTGRMTQTGRFETLRHEIAATGGVKAKRFVPAARAVKGVLFKYLLTSDEPFFLYREESHVVIQPWGTPTPLRAHLFGNDDLDRTRGMTAASLAAARAGGGTQ